MPDAEFLALMRRAERHRYSGWRNWEGRWRDVLGLDITHGQIVLDYGSGAGFEAAQYAASGNIVALADISELNLQVAKRTVGLFTGYYPASYLISESDPFLDVSDGMIDVVHCSGVLHHIPDPVP